MTKKIIVISAVNLVHGGTLTILRNCLSYLSELANTHDYTVIAIVNKRELADYPNIEYIETTWPKKNWINRLWYEYVSMYKISKDIGDVYLWFSLHDTTPNVRAQRRAVYCHNPFPFYQWNWREWFLTPKIVLFALFSKYAYRINIKKNTNVVVQQQWIRTAFKNMFGLDRDKIIVAIPDCPNVDVLPDRKRDNTVYRFFYAASANSHKNFECLTEAAKLLSVTHGGKFEVLVTVNGSENAYARWLKKEWGEVKELSFIGFLNRVELFQHYADADALVFPSKVETWGLPITEFSMFNKPMLLADLPYTYETAAGCDHVAFFSINDPQQLSLMMENLLLGKDDFLQTVPESILESPYSSSWEGLFSKLLN